MSPTEKIDAAVAATRNGHVPLPVSEDALKATLAKLQAENAALASRLAVKEKAHAVSLKISGKGALSAYGLGRFPITLYAEQWIKLLDMADTIRAFIQANVKEFRGKEETEEAYTKRTGRKSQAKE